MFVVFFFKQKTAYEMRISDWSSDVCSSDLAVVIRTIRVDVVVRTATTDEDERRQVRTIAEGVEQIGAECVVVEVGTQLLAGFDGFRRTVQFITETVFTLMTEQIGKASCRERICQALWFSVVAESLKKK